jgi:hypothetical protein
MTTVIVLLVILINLFVSFALIALLYQIAFLPVKEELKRLEGIIKKHQSRTTSTATIPHMGEYYSAAVNPPNDLPDLDDIPDEAFYGEEPEDFKITLEDVEDAIAERSYTNYNRPRTTSTQQLGSLKM